MKIIKLNPIKKPERLKKAALLCLMLGGAALIFGSVIVSLASAALACSLACFVVALVLVLWVQASGQG